MQSPTPAARAAAWIATILLAPALAVAAPTSETPREAAARGAVPVEAVPAPPASERPSNPSAARQTDSATADADPFASVERLDRDTLVTAVLERNPSLEAARAAWEAARQRIVQVSALDDPRLSYGIAPLSVFSDDVDFGQTLEVSQMLPYPGKRQLRAEAAEARAAGQRMAWEEMRLELTRMASDLLYDLYLVDRSLEINRQHIRLLEELKETATIRYSSGLAPQQVPLQAEVELTHLVHREVTLEAARGVVEARLNALLHRPAARPLPPPAPLADEDLPVQVLAERVIAAWGDAAATYPGGVRDRAAQEGLLEAERNELEALAGTALTARPELRAAEAEVRARRIERELAGLERRPDFGVMGTYSSMWRELEHQIMVGVSVNLPIRKERIRAAEAEAELELEAAEARRRALADTVRAEVVQAADRLAEMARVVDLYEARLLPAARDQLRAARSGFETGQVTFLNVVDAEKNLRSVELGYEEALTDRHRRRADLERALGLAPGAAVGLAPSEAPSEPPPPASPEAAPVSDSDLPHPGGSAVDLAAGMAGGVR